MDEVTRVELPNGRYCLTRESDSVGDSGMMLEAVDRYDPNVKPEKGVMEVGKGVRCGSHYGRSYATQDWWLTTSIKKFLEVSEDKTMVRFETENGKIYKLTVS